MMSDLLMSQAEYAMHRGVSRAAITNFKNQGLLVMDGSKVNVAQSDARLARSLNPLQTSATNTSKQDYLTARTQETQAKALKEQLAAHEAAHNLVSADAVANAVMLLGRQAQQSLLTMVDRLAPLVAAETDQGRVHQILEAEVREVCDGIASGVDCVL